jgi:dephospho-CoA kinase/inosine/xanthosine triphosphate pyrophosphatase family protein
MEWNQSEKAAMTSIRPRLRPTFFSKDRQILLHFYTSSTEKFLHARTICSKQGLLLGHSRSKVDPYDEEYSKGTEALLESAINQVAEVISAQSVFFVEDTSLRIEALSHGGQDVPGLAVKEWFRSLSFAELDALLQEYGSRHCTVMSDIGLHLPGLDRPVFFHGETKGSVATGLPEFSQSPQHPWLGPHNFNGLFVPEGAERPLGAMSFEDSWPFDFRVKSLNSLLDRLEEWTAAANLPISAYARRRGTVQGGSQLPLIPGEVSVAIVLGMTCAGKTTFGDYADTLGFQVIDASSVVRLLAERHNLVDASSYITAKNVLQKLGPDCVARAICEEFVSDRARGLVICGFRTMEEVDYVRSIYPTSKIVWIDSSERTRLERAIQRNRPGAPSDIADLRQIDREQMQFGLLNVGREICSLRIENEGMFSDFHAQIEFSLGDTTTSAPRGVAIVTRGARDLETNQLYRALRALASAGRPLTAAEISSSVAANGGSLRPNNANKVLRNAPGLAHRFEQGSAAIRYAITEAGRAYLRMIGTEGRGIQGL